MRNDFETNIRAIYELWNAGDLEGVLKAFARLGPKGFTVEYVGETPMEGVAAVRDMWSRYDGCCKTEIIELLVNGTEAAAHINNRISLPDGGEISLPSIETYREDGDHLAVRYYHRSA